MSPTDFTPKRKVCAYLAKVEAMSDYEFKAHIDRLQGRPGQAEFDLGNLLFASRSLDKLVNLLTLSAKSAGTDEVRETFAELVVQIQSARHDASLDWAIDQEHQRVT